MADDAKQKEILAVINEWGLSFELGSVLKNLARIKDGKEGELELLKKAKYYLDSRIESIETESKRAKWRNKKKVARNKKPSAKKSTSPRPARVAAPAAQPAD